MGRGLGSREGLGKKLLLGFSRDVEVAYVDQKVLIEVWGAGIGR